MSMDSSGDQDAGERRTGPTVTRDRWVNHARQKLLKGYVLIVSGTRKNANFYSPQKGYEMCAFDVARKLISERIVEKTRKHHLGDVYELAGPIPEPPVVRRPAVDDDEEEDAAPVEVFDTDLEDDELAADDDEVEEAEASEYDDAPDEDEDDLEDEL